MVQQSVDMSGSPAISPRQTFRLKGYSTNRDTRYSLGRLPPELGKVCRELCEISDGHKAYPRVAVSRNGFDLKSVIKSTAGIEVIEADAYLRALENLAVLIEVEVNGDETIMLFDRIRMYALIQFSIGGSFAEMDEESVLVRARELLEVARIEKTKSPVPEPILERPSDPALPDYDEVNLAIASASQTITIGKIVLSDVVTDPLEVLKIAFPKCRKIDRLEALLSFMIRAHHLTPLSADGSIYHYASDPESDPLLAKLTPGVAKEFDLTVEAKLVEIERSVRETRTKLEEKRSRQQEERASKMQEINRRFETQIKEATDEVQRLLEGSIAQYQAERDSEREKSLADLRDEIANLMLIRVSQINERVEAKLLTRTAGCKQEAASEIDAKTAAIKAKLSEALVETEATIATDEQKELASTQEELDWLEQMQGRLKAVLEKK
jgi:hypothetical protein